MIADEKPKSTQTGLPRGLIILLLWTAIVPVWVGSFWLVVQTLELLRPMDLPDTGDMISVLFGTSSIALFIFSFLSAILALRGWDSLKENVRKEVEATTLGRIEKLEHEIRGRVLTLTGFMIGSSHSNPLSLTQSDGDLEHLAESVSLCERGYKILKNAAGGVRHMALNNLVYYSCLHQDDEKHAFFLEQAQTLRKVGEDNDIPDYVLTYCRVILQYGSRQDDFRTAHGIAKGFERSDVPLTPRQKKEAAFYAAKLGERIKPAKVLPG